MSNQFKGTGDSASVAIAGIPSNAYYSNAYTASYRYRIDQNWAIMAQVMRIEGSNTEITGRSRQDVTNRYGLHISYS